MPYKPPISNTLTESQAQALSKFSAIKTYTSSTAKLKQKIRDKLIPKTEQISPYDYLVKMICSVIGPAAVDIVLKSFLDKIFGKGDKLAIMVSKSIAASLDKNNIKLSKTEKNQEWLNAKISPTLKTLLEGVKTTIVLLIISMIFGPKKKMKEYAKNSDMSEDDLLNAAVCSSEIFSLSNSPTTPQGDLEYNKIQLRKQLEQGNVEFVISCQTVKIKLPENLEQTLQSSKVSNPADIFNNLNNYVSQEISRQNVPQNSNSASKSFLQTTNEKIFQLLPTVLMTQLTPIFDLINTTAKGEDSSFTDIDFNSIIASSCEVTNMPDSNSDDFKNKTSFQSALLNMLFALLLSILFKKITKYLKELIATLYVTKAAKKVEKAKRKLKMRSGFLNKAGKLAERAELNAQAMKGINVIYGFVNDLKTNTIV